MSARTFCVECTKNKLKDFTLSVVVCDSWIYYVALFIIWTLVFILLFASESSLISTQITKCKNNDNY